MNFIKRQHIQATHYDRFPPSDDVHDPLCIELAEYAGIESLGIAKADCGPTKCATDNWNPSRLVSNLNTLQEHK